MCMYTVAVLDSVYRGPMTLKITFIVKRATSHGFTLFASFNP